MQLADLDTVDPLSSTRDGADAEVVGLTILAHPEASRVGEVTLLFGLSTGGARRVNRLEPEFHQPSGGPGRPLATPMVSRKPLLILSVKTGERSSFMLEPGQEMVRANVDGAPLTKLLEVDPARLERGIVLELGGVLLLLHRLAPEESPEDNLGLSGHSEGIQGVRAAIHRVADQDTTVLIRGESGSGKELVARAIHSLSQRSARAYVAVNAAAIPPAMAAAALFGHTRGAFTGAQEASSGFFGQAERGTLFLDEIGEAPRDVQALLLRAVREGELQPVGSTQPKKADVRVLAATDANLEAMVERGEFLEPLLRRLESFTLRVPPLRERRDDIARLFFEFLRSELERVDELHKLDPPARERKPWMPAPVIHALLDYHWPGNVAELATVTRRVVLTNRGLRKLTLDQWIVDRLPRGSAGEVDSVQGHVLAERRKPKSLSDAEIAAAMKLCRFKVGATAEQLGVSRAWLHTRLEFCAGVRQAKDLERGDVQAALERCQGDTQRMAEELEVSEHGLKMRMRALGVGGPH